ncbi:MAG: RNA polymerase sigma factor [Chitinophagaceae bacterium]|nr:MAG: RNA polymerase sigma factor [Chitinophagaceae bacterium]
MNEWTLIEQLRQGDEAAFKKIVEAWQDLVYNTAFGIVQNAEDAEDVAQDVFVQVYESINTFKGESKLSTWLYRITISKAMDHIRRKNRKKRFAFVRALFTDENEAVVHPPDFNHPGVILDNREKSATLMKAVGELPDNQRIAFTLHKIEGLSYQEISEVMDTSVSSVESLMHRAKTNLKKNLENFYRQDL